MAVSNDYTLLLKIQVDASSITGDHDQFTGLITEDALKLSKSFTFSHTDDGGGDVRLSDDESGLNQLPIDVVTWDKSSETCQLWYLADGISGTAPKYLYLWGGNAGSSQPAASSAYGRNSVYVNEINRMHMENVNPIDSAGNQLTITPHNITAEAGYIGNSLRFNGSSSYINLNAPILPVGDFTQSVWFKPDDVVGFQGLIGNWVSGDPGRTYLGLNGNSFNWDGYSTAGNSRGVADTGWHMMVVTRTGSSVDVVVNGVKQGTSIFDDGIPHPTRDVIIGALQNGTNYFFDGLIGDNFLSNTYDNGDTLLTKFNNQSNVSGFYLEPVQYGGQNSSVESIVSILESKPIFNISASSELPEPVLNVNIELSAPLFNVAANSELPQPIANIDTAMLSPLFSVKSNASLPLPVANVSIDFLSPTFSIDASAELPVPKSNISIDISQPTFSISATAEALTVSMDVSVDVDAPIFSVDAETTIPTFSAVSFEVAGPLFSVESSVTIPDAIANIDMAIGRPSFNVTMQISGVNIVIPKTGASITYNPGLNTLIYYVDRNSLTYQPKSNSIKY